MTIAEIAKEIERNALDTPISKLQHLRKSIKQLRRRPGSRIFNDETISENWAFHYGGRTELQFNIGYESNNTEIRYGIAFSLKITQTLLDISILFPSIYRFNNFIERNPRYFNGFGMWHYINDEGNGEVRTPMAISDDLLIEGTFIFIGNKMPINSINFDRIIDSWNYLLKVYKYIESNDGVEPDEISENGNRYSSGLNFIAGHSPSATYTTASIQRQSVDINIRHAKMQTKLYNELLELYDQAHIGTEIFVFGNRVDLVVSNDNEVIFYEIKTAPTAKACVREAIGQLLEYCFYKCGNNAGQATKLVIVGEPNCDQVTEEYMQLLTDKIQMPIEYKRITA